MFYKNFILICLFILIHLSSTSSTSFASVPLSSTTYVEPYDELEILALPYKNQIEILKQKSISYENLISIAKNSKYSISQRWKAIIIAVQIKKQNALPDLMVLSSMKEWFVKNAVLVSLKDITHPRQQIIAKTLLKDDSLVVRSAAVNLLIESQFEQNRELLWDELFNKKNIYKNQSLWIRKQILSALVENPKVYERFQFSKLMNETDPEILKLGILGAEKIIFDPEFKSKVSKLSFRSKASQFKNKLSL